MDRQTFRRSERLKKLIFIRVLFSQGKSFHCYPFRIYYHPLPEGLVKHQVLFSVPTRNFKRAVDRNTLRRRALEAYRKQKSAIINTPKETAFMIGFVYTSKKKELYSKISTGMASSLAQLANLFVMDTRS